MSASLAPGLLVLAVALVVICCQLIARARRPIPAVASAPVQPAEQNELADDLAAIIAAIQDGHVDAPPDVIRACDLALWEIEFGGAA